MITNTITVPFSEKELIQIKSSKKDEFAFLGQQVISITDHKNMSQAFKDAKCIKGKDFVIIKRSDNPNKFQELLDLFATKPNVQGKTLSNIIKVQNNTFFGSNPNKVQELTMVYESGFWKLAISSKLPNGIALRNWLATEVLPSIRKTGSFSLSSLNTSELLTHTKRDVQVSNSKKVNTYFYKSDSVNQSEIIKYNIENCRQVTGLYPNQVEGKGNSAKEKLRNTKPELASVMSFNDDLVVQEGVKLSDLKELDKIAAALFLELEEIGIRFIGN